MPIYNLSYQGWIRAAYYCLLKLFMVFSGFSVTWAFLAYTMEKLTEKCCYLSHLWSDQAFKGIVVNQALTSLHVGSLKITLTVPLKVFVSGDKIFLREWPAMYGCCTENVVVWRNFEGWFENGFLQTNSITTLKNVVKILQQTN